MMQDGTIIGWGYKFLKILLVILIVAGIIFLVWFFFENRPLDVAGHQDQLELLQEAYQIRRNRFRRVTEEKVETAPNEVLAIKYQQELSQNLDKTEDLYFRDLQSILSGNYQVLKTHWGPEIDMIRKKDEESQKNAPEE